MKTTKDDKPLKETQGHRKLRQYLEDLKRNKHFIAKVNKIKAQLVSEDETRDDRDLEAELNSILEDYDELRKVCERIRATHPSVTAQVMAEMAEEYGVDDDMFFAISIPEILQSNDFELGNIHDMCTLSDNYDIHFNTVFPYKPFELDWERQRHYRAYPVSIDLHKFSTKRDVLDFIEKRWVIIESYLTSYRGQKKVRFRQRKYARKILDCIWLYRKLDLKGIKSKLDEKFPENGIVYFEISKLLSLERKRRLRKINVGQ